MALRLKRIGPGALVAAAFIGPGTITTASISGARYGYTLIWAIFVSIVATLVLQEMSLRLAVVSRNSLGQSIRLLKGPRWLKWLVISLTILAILIGNAAYEAGNLTGAVLGMEAMGLKSLGLTPIVMLLALSTLSALLLFFSGFKAIERLLAILVALMGIVFIPTALLLDPNWSNILGSLFVPDIPEASIKMIIALIGTTVVPYNLFLHSSSATKSWQTPDQLGEARLDMLVSIVLGGIITMSILVCASAVFHQEPDREFQAIADLAEQLEILLGSAAATIMGIGFLAAGLSSAITAPLAAAFTCTEVLGFRRDTQSSWHRFFWLLVLLTGTIIASLGIRPFGLILIAQFTNGIILPLVAIILLYILNQKEVMGDYRNKLLSNILGMAVIVICLTLGIKSFAQGFGIW